MEGSGPAPPTPRSAKLSSVVASTLLKCGFPSAALTISAQTSCACVIKASDRGPAPSEVIKEGYLYKRGGSHGGFVNWKRRYFRLTSHALSYFASPSSKRCRGHILLVESPVFVKACYPERKQTFGVFCAASERTPLLIQVRPWHP